MIKYGVIERADLPSLMRLYRQLSPENPDISDEKADVVWNDIKASGARYFAAKEDGEVISTCYIAIIPNLTHGGRPIGYIENVITDEKCRSRGIGGKVVGMALDYARETGCHKAVLLSGYHREAAHRFYASLGFDGDMKRGFSVYL